MLSVLFLLVLIVVIAPFVFLFLGFYLLGRASDMKIVNDTDVIKSDRLRRKGWIYIILSIAFFASWLVFKII